MSEKSKETLARLKGVPTKQELEDMLDEFVVICNFKKLDGEERTMELTRCTTYIPKDKLPKGEHKPHETNITGWCDDVEGWRSFRYDRLISAKPNLHSTTVKELANQLRDEINKSIIESVTEEAEWLAEDKIQAFIAGREPYTIEQLRELHKKFGGPCL
jgi:hypothetical protein